MGGAARVVQLPALPACAAACCAPRACSPNPPTQAALPRLGTQLRPPPAPPAPAASPLPADLPRARVWQPVAVGAAGLQRQRVLPRIPQRQPAGAQEPQHLRASTDLHRQVCVGGSSHLDGSSAIGGGGALAVTTWRPAVGSLGRLSPRPGTNHRTKGVRWMRSRVGYGAGTPPPPLPPWTRFLDDEPGETCSGPLGAAPLRLSPGRGWARCGCTCAACPACPLGGCFLRLVTHTHTHTHTHRA